MPSKTQQLQIIIDAASKDDLLRALSAAASEDAVADSQFQLVEGNAAIARSELQLEPITTTVAALYVANIVLSGVVGYFIGKGLDKFFKSKPQHIIVVMPDGERLKYDPSKPEEAQRLLEYFRRGGD